MVNIVEGGEGRVGRSGRGKGEDVGGSEGVKKERERKMEG